MITIQEYQKALGHLSEAHKRILKTLYFRAPFQDTNEIADALKYGNFGAVNLHIGTIGKTIAKYLHIHPTETYPHSTGNKPSYYTIVHDKFETGWDLQDNLREAIKLDLRNKVENEFHNLSTELSSDENHYYIEGKAYYTLVNKYERDKKARSECLRLKGNICHGCSIDFSIEYGHDISNDLVHIHHLTKLSDIRKDEAKNVLDDLVPLCPNCHAVVHSKENLMTIEELKQRRKKLLRGI